MKKISLPLPPELNSKFCDICDYYKLSKSRCGQYLFHVYSPFKNSISIKNYRIDNYKNIEYYKSAYGEKTSQGLIEAMSLEAHKRLCGDSSVTAIEAVQAIANMFGCTSNKQLYTFLTSWLLTDAPQISRDAATIQFGLTAQAFDIAATIRTAIEAKHKELYAEEKKVGLPD